VRRLGVTVIVIAAAAAFGAPALAPNPPDAAFSGLLNAPPTRLHIRDQHGEWRRPFIYRWRLLDRLEQTYDEDRATPVPVAWFSRGRFVSSSDPDAPLLLLGADSFGRDVLSRRSSAHGHRSVWRRSPRSWPHCWERPRVDLPVTPAVPRTTF
jgi:ABC-type dipeptide/oligopeptide/nickel transport system permease subunit